MNISNKRLLEVFNGNSQDFYKNTENKDQKSKHWKTRMVRKSQMVIL